MKIQRRRRKKLLLKKLLECTIASEQFCKIKYRVGNLKEMKSESFALLVKYVKEIKKDSERDNKSTNKNTIEEEIQLANLYLGHL